MGDRKATEDEGWEINERGGGKAGDDRGQNGRTVSPDLHPDLTKGKHPPLSIPSGT